MLLLTNKQTNSLHTKISLLEKTINIETFKYTHARAKGSLEKSKQNGNAPKTRSQ